MLSFSRLILLNSLCALFLGGCVVSTQGGVGTPPDVPLKPQLVSEIDESERNGPYQIGARHILISYEGAMSSAAYVTRSKEEAAQLAEELRARALAGEDFALLAEENSDDRGSAANGGSLGTFTREQMVPEFSRAAFALEIEAISEVVESGFGFHVIQRTQ